jgi:hypothetical protein
MPDSLRTQLSELAGYASASARLDTPAAVRQHGTPGVAGAAAVAHDVAVPAQDGSRPSQRNTSRSSLAFFTTKLDPARLATAVTSAISVLAPQRDAHSTASASSAAAP